MHLKHYWAVINLLIFAQSIFAQPPIYKRLTQEADSLFEAKSFAAAAETYSKAFAANNYKAYQEDRYNAACAWALAGQKDSAFFQLFYITKKVTYSDLNHLTTDADLNGLHLDPRWKELSDMVKKNKDAEEINLDKPLAAMLDSVFTEDQKYRVQIEDIEKKYGRESAEMKAHWATINQADSLNLIKIKAVLDKYGWLGADVVGKKGASALFLVIQHADIKEQEKYLPMMREAVKNKKAQGSSLALLEDRVALRQGKKQIYGSQIGRKPTGEHYVSPLEDPDNVDKRRAEVGLPPIADYIKNWNMTWDVEAYKKMLPELVEQDKR